MQRNEIQAKYKWKTQDIFEDDAAWEREFSAWEEDFAKTDFSVYENTFEEKAKLLEYLRLVSVLPSLSLTS